MTITEELAVQQAFCDPAVRAALRELRRAKGGRPKGSKNRVCKTCGCHPRRKDALPEMAERGQCRCAEPTFVERDALDRAVTALSVQREASGALPGTAALRASEWRVSRCMAGPWKDKGLSKVLEALGAPHGARLSSRKMRDALAVLGYRHEEMDAVLAYQRSEDRVGMSRMRRFKAVPATIGAGYEDPVVPDDETDKEAAGVVKKTTKPHKPKRRFGYPTAPEPIVESSLPAETVVLWNVEVKLAVKDEPGVEPVRARRSGRRWLAPVNGTEEFQIGDRTVVGAGTGENGEAPLWAWEPTIGECRKAELEKDRQPSGLVCQPHRAPYRAPLANFIELRVKRALGTKETRHYGVPRVFGPLPRSEGEKRAGQYECRWRLASWPDAVRAIVVKILAGKLSGEKAEKAIKKAKKWLAPEGLLPEPAAPVDKDVFALAAAIIAAQKPARAEDGPEPKTDWDAYWQRLYEWLDAKERAAGLVT